MMQQIGGRNPEFGVNHVLLVSPYVCLCLFYIFAFSYYDFMGTNLYKLSLNNVFKWLNDEYA